MLSPEELGLPTGRLMTTKEVAAFLVKHTDTILAWRASGLLPEALRCPDGSYLFRPLDVAAVAPKQNEVEPEIEDKLVIADDMIEATLRKYRA